MTLTNRSHFIKAFTCHNHGIVKGLLGSLLLVIFLSGCAIQPGRDREDHWFARDKYAHFAVSTVASAALAKNAKNNGHDDCDAALIGFSITLSIGAAKETYDKRIKKTLYSARDMVWDTAGSLLGSLAASGCH
ncbi:MAG: hypothetical protein PVF34_12760 [Gammaproteobacteria bacterium]